jgi:proline iminopeptidase
MTSTSSSPLTPGPHAIDVGGIVQRYHVSGTGPVCLVHPGGPGFSWEYLRMPAVEDHLTTVYIEPIGTGGSGRLAAHPNGYTREEYARALTGLIEHLGAASVHLMGHSHGGFVTQFFAQRSPSRLAGIILYESAPAIGPEHFAEAAANLEAFARANAGRPELEDVLDAWRSVPAIDSDEAFTMAARRLLPAYFADYWGRESEFAPMAASVSGSYISGLDACMAPVAIDDRTTLDSITVPTLVIVGRHDFICGPRWAQEIHDRIAGSALVTLEKSGHFGHVEEPESFARAVAEFVRPTSVPRGLYLFGQFLAGEQFEQAVLRRTRTRWRETAGPGGRRCGPVAGTLFQQLFWNRVPAVSR